MRASRPRGRLPRAACSKAGRPRRWRRPYRCCSASAAARSALPPLMLSRRPERRLTLRSAARRRSRNGAGALLAPADRLAANDAPSDRCGERRRCAPASRGVDRRAGCEVRARWHCVAARARRNPERDRCEEGLRDVAGSLAHARRCRRLAAWTDRGATVPAQLLGLLLETHAASRLQRRRADAAAAAQR